MSSDTARSSAFEVELAAGLRTRQEEAFEELYRRFGRRMLSVCRSILKEEEAAKDALQEAVIKVLLTPSHFRGDGRLWYWIRRITVNVCLETLRKGKKDLGKRSEDPDLDNLEDLVLASPVNHARQAEVTIQVRSGLQQLSPKHRQASLLHLWNGFTIPEISRRIGVSEGTVKSRIWYGREQLRRRLV